MGKELAVIDATGYALTSFDAKEASEAIRETVGAIDIRRDLTTLTGVNPGGKSWDLVLPTGEVEELKSVAGVIVAQRKMRSYYDTPYEPGTTTPPLCSAEPNTSGDWYGQSEDKDLDGRACESCPHNRFGTAQNGKGKACSEYTALIMYRPDDALLPINVRVPPAALKAWRNYTMALIKLDPRLRLVNVVTEVALEPVKGSTPEWKFKLLGKVDEATAKQLAARAALFAAASTGAPPVDQPQTNEPPAADDAPPF
jgi:hypothetical protein